jgi:hypothetical protein
MDRAGVDTNSAETAKEPHFANGFFILNRVGDRRDAGPAAGCRFEFSAKTIQLVTKLLRENGKNFEPEKICSLC